MLKVLFHVKIPTINMSLLSREQLSVYFNIYIYIYIKWFKHKKISRFKHKESGVSHYTC